MLAAAQAHYLAMSTLHGAVKATGITAAALTRAIADANRGTLSEQPFHHRADTALAALDAAYDQLASVFDGLTQ